MAKKKTQAIIAQPGTPADGYTLDVKYEPENGDAFEAKAIFNDGTVKNLGSGGSGGSANVYYITSDENGENYLFLNSDFTPAQPAHIGNEYLFKAETAPETYDEANSVLSELIKTEFYLIFGMNGASGQKLTYSCETTGNAFVIRVLYGFDSIAQTGELQYFRLAFDSNGNIVQHAHN